MMDESMKVGIYNGLLGLLAVVSAFILVQHAVFFYSIPPDPSRYIAINPMVYGTLGAWIFIFMKLWHWIEVCAEVYKHD